MTTSEPARPPSDVVASLHAAHGEPLRRFLLGMLRDRQAAEDVFQTTFAKFAQQGGGVRPESYKAWLFRVAANEAISLKRREKTGRHVREQLVWLRPDPTDAADTPVLRAEWIALVRRELEKLPAEQLQLVRMRIYEEKTFAVIAEELGIPLGTALARMRAAVGKIRQALEKHRDKK